ncbi:MAG: hypothetical protein GC159_19930 [Phycisphaera sp.]|nr:hypothetical protein [Phycisphaera sp.]
MFVIDAYNVLHCSHLLPDAHTMISATGLARLLDAYDVPPHRGGAIVVADGSRKPDDEREATFDRVRLIFPGPGRDADSVIEGFIESDSGPRGLVVVSNDRRLQRAARRRRAEIWTSEQFMLRLARVLESAAGKPPSSEATPGAMGDAEHWMRQFGLTGDPTPAPPDAAPKQRDKSSDPPRDKPTDPPSRLESETDRWMREFGYDPDKD